MKKRLPAPKGLMLDLCIMVDVFCACIETGVRPRPGSPCHKMALNLVKRCGYKTSRKVLALPKVEHTKVTTQVADAEHLQKILSDHKQQHFFIALNGCARSSKDITWQEDGRYQVYNSIDDSWQYMSWKQLVAPRGNTKTLVGQALAAKALYWEYTDVPVVGRHTRRGR